MSTTAAATGAFGHRPGLTEARAAQAALAGADLSKLWRLSDAEVAEALGGLEAVRATAERQQVAVMAEARTRGLGAADGWGAVDWATQAAPGMSTGHASTLQAVATACQDPRLAALAESLGTGRVSLPKAAQLARYHAAVERNADPGQLAADTQILIARPSASSPSPSGTRRPCCVPSARPSTSSSGVARPAPCTSRVARPA